MAEGVQGVLWSVFWAILLFLLSFELAFLCAFWYILLLPFTLCYEPLGGLADVFLCGIRLPHFCADCMIHKRSTAEALHKFLPNGT